MTIRKVASLAAIVAIICMLPAGALVRAQDKDAQEVADTVAAFKKSDKSLVKWFDSAHGYAVFPTVGKGGVVVGGASGDGRVTRSFLSSMARAV